MPRGGRRRSTEADAQPAPATVDGEEEESQTCPVCKSDKYLNPDLQLLVSPCYHRVCSLCVERLFAHGSAPCPVCGTALRRSNFALPTFEDVRVEKECRIRQRLAAIFNKPEEDFVSLRAYNDYLEEVEGLVWNLVNDVDVQATNAKLEAYRQANLAEIARNRERQQAEERSLRAAQEAEEAQRVNYEMGLLAEMEAEEEERRDRERQFIDQLAAAGESANPMAGAGRKMMMVVGREGKRKAQAAALIEMPSMKGLRTSTETGSRGPPPPIDPFETVPAVILPPGRIPAMASLEEIPPKLLFGSRVPDLSQLRAGGVTVQAALQQVFIALYSC